MCRWTSTWNRLRRLVLVTLVIGLALGSAPGSSRGEPSDASAVAPAATDSSTRTEGDLRARARAYWDARIARSQKVYEFYAPPEKGGASRDRISEGGNMIFTTATIEAVEIDGDLGVVRVWAEYSVVLPRAVPLPDVQGMGIREGWSRVDGTWYRDVVPPGLSHRFRRQKQEAEATASGAVDGSDVPAPPDNEPQGEAKP
jgi:hypothetical protein